MSGEGGRARVLGLVMPQGAGDAMAAGVQCTQLPWGGSQRSSAGSATPDAKSSSLRALFTSLHLSTAKFIAATPPFT